MASGAERRARFRGPADGRSRLFFSQHRLPPLADLLLRIAVAIGLLLLSAVIVYAERDCYADRGNAGTLTFLDSLYYATVTLTTTGYGDIVPICQSSRLVNIVVITPLRIVFLVLLIGTTVSVLTRQTREEFRSQRWRSTVKDHTLVIGFGVKGRSAAKALVDSGIKPGQIVVVTPDRMAVDEATRAGYIGVIGDARREETLKDAAIEKSRQVVVAADEDDTAVLITLTARRLAPAARIVTAVRESVNADVLRQSGADAVIPTAESAGRLMGLSLVSEAAGDLMEDLLDSSRGLEVTERDITREELGLSPADLDARGQIVLAVVRNGVVHRFDEAEGIAILQQGDRLVVIRHNDGAPPHEPR